MTRPIVVADADGRVTSLDWYEDPALFLTSSDHTSLAPSCKADEVAEIATRTHELRERIGELLSLLEPGDAWAALSIVAHELDRCAAFIDGALHRMKGARRVRVKTG